MSERRKWTAKDRDEVLRLFPEETVRDGDNEAICAAKHFGCEVRESIPAEDGYWSLEPRCVLSPWYRRPNESRWDCLGCRGIWAFSSDIEAEFLRMLKAKYPECAS